MGEPTQAHRPIAVGTPLGDNVLLLRSFSYTEQLGRPFQISLDLLSTDPQINFDDIVGRNVTLRFQKPADDQPRFLNSIVSEFAQTRRFGRYTQYQATAVPWLWLLTRTSDCRIFQQKTVPDILKEIFREGGFTDIEDRLSGTHPTWEYCVQYRETNFNFVSRLMEQEGIYYFFQHEDGKHTLVLADSPSAHQPYGGYEQIPFRPPDSAFREREYVHDLTCSQRVQPGAYAQTDYNYESPRTSLLTRSQISRAHGAPDYEIFDYPGEYGVFADGENYARWRIEELQAQYELFHAETDARGMVTGCKFTLADHPRDDFNQEYLIVSTTIQAATDEFESSRSAEGGPTFGCTFTALDFRNQFRTPRVTPKPMIRGPQTAMVVGPSGEEIHTEKYGRVKVQFHWDRYSQANENSSCWIRVSQPWAGKKWGGVFLPRIGQEVIVEFLEGDPDRPIVTGRVYNDGAMPPYDLPANATRSTVKSNSSKGGGGFNELRFEDKKDSEQIFVHAQKDQDTRVRNTSREWIGNERHLIVKKKQFEMVEEDKHLHVKKSQFEQIDIDRHGHVKGDDNQKIDGTLSVTAGQDMQEKVGVKHALDAGLEIHLKAGMKVVIEGGLQVTLKGPGGFVDIGPAGVTIQGTLVNINSGGAAGVGSGCSPGSPTAPQDPKEAASDQAGEVSQPPPAGRPPRPVTYSSQATVMQMAAASGAPFCEKCAAAAAAQAAQSSSTPGQ